MGVSVMQYCSSSEPEMSPAANALGLPPSSFTIPNSTVYQYSCVCVCVCPLRSVYEKEKNTDGFFLFFLFLLVLKMRNEERLAEKYRGGEKCS